MEKENHTKSNMAKLLKTKEKEKILKAVGKKLHGTNWMGRTKMDMIQKQ
jgi:hypothetical protein